MPLLAGHQLGSENNEMNRATAKDLALTRHVLTQSARV